MRETIYQERKKDYNEGLICKTLGRRRQERIKKELLILNTCFLSFSLTLRSTRSAQPEARFFLLKVMAGNAAKSVAKAIGEFQYPWADKLAKYKNELSKGVWGYWELGAWKSLGISARRRARLRKEVLLAGQDWPYDPARKEMRTKRKGHKCDRISAEKRENSRQLMEKMPSMLLDYKKRRWEKKMKEEESKK